MPILILHAIHPQNVLGKHMPHHTQDFCGGGEAAPAPPPVQHVSA